MSRRAGTRTGTGDRLEVRTTRTDRLLGGIERVGNRIPEPFVLFLGLFCLLAVVSTAMALAGVSVEVPGSGESNPVRGFFTAEGVQWFTTNLVDNFVSFPPLGTVVVILLAVGLAQRSGLMATLVKVAFAGAPRWALPYAVAFIGVVGSVMADSVMIVIPPLAAMVFKAVGRHPVAGLLGAFAAAGAGYSTSIAVTSLDALFAGITSSVAQTLPDAGTPVTPVSNWYYNIASSLLLTLVCGLLITRVLEPMLTRTGVPTEQRPDAEGPGAVEDVDDLTVPRADRRALGLAGVAALVTAAALVVLAVVPGSPMRNEAGGYLPESPLLDSTVFLVVCMLTVPALVFGRRTGSLRRLDQVPAAMGEAVKDMAPFIVLAFVLGQFVALFTWTRVGTWMAVAGAGGLESLNLTGFEAIVGFVLLATVLNLFITSGSSMWTIMGAVFVPLFALLGYEPAFTQAAFRAGDSATQILTPLNPYIVVVLAMLRRYEPQAGLGTLISRFLPFTVCFWIAWVALLTLWFVLDLPLGPGQYSRL